MGAVGPPKLCNVVFVCLFFFFLAEASAAFIKFKKINNNTYFRGLWWE